MEAYKKQNNFDSRSSLKKKVRKNQNLDYFNAFPYNFL